MDCVDDFSYDFSIFMTIILLCCVYACIHETIYSHLTKSFNGYVEMHYVKNSRNTSSFIAYNYYITLNMCIMHANAIVDAIGEPVDSLCRDDTDAPIT